MRQLVLALIVDVAPSEHVIVVDKEGEIEGEIDQRAEHLYQGKVLIQST